MTSRAEEIFFELFEALPRQGPGSLDCTRRALALCADLPPAPRVLDLGCGSGAQTLHLAMLSAGKILAIDAHAPLVARLRAAVVEHGLAAHVEARVARIESLVLEAESFDLVWSEGALYNLGLGTALERCAGWLRPGGSLAFTEAVWRSDDPPSEVRQAFADYPGMGPVEEVVALLATGGFERVEHFPLPDEAWWQEFYAPMEQRIAELRAKYAGDADALAALDAIAAEPALHRRSGRHYGYEFFVARKRGGANAADRLRRG